jgi:hypothetical protein
MGFSEGTGWVVGVDEKQEKPSQQSYGKRHEWCGDDQRQF